jgi:hypothetical protein
MPEIGSDLDRRNQEAVDRLYGNDPGNLWRVALPDQPQATLPALDQADAIRKYNAAFGILSTVYPHSVWLVEERTPAG